jgi:hypothetical protein
MVHQSSAQANNGDWVTSGDMMLPVFMRHGVRAAWVLLGSAWLMVAGFLYTVSEGVQPCSRHTSPS